MYIDIVILSQLIHGPKHGYKIKQNVAFILGNTYKLNNNTLYPRLKKFEEIGAVEKTVEINEGSPNRFQYSITEKGRDLFQKLLQQVNEKVVADDNEFYNRLGFFSLLDGENRDKLLQLRIQHLQNRIDFIDQMALIVNEEDYFPFSQQLYIYSKAKSESEIKIIESLRDSEKDREPG